MSHAHTGTSRPDVTGTTVRFAPGAMDAQHPGQGETIQQADHSLSGKLIGPLLSHETEIWEPVAGRCLVSEAGLDIRLNDLLRAARKHRPQGRKVVPPRGTQDENFLAQEFPINSVVLRWRPAANLPPE